MIADPATTPHSTKPTRTASALSQQVASCTPQAVEVAVLRHCDGTP